jgi:hypothetical protein
MKIPDEKFRKRKTKRRLPISLTIQRTQNAAPAATTIRPSTMMTSRALLALALVASFAATFATAQGTSRSTTATTTTASTSTPRPGSLVEASRGSFHKKYKKKGGGHHGGGHQGGTKKDKTMKAVAVLTTCSLCKDVSPTSRASTRRPYFFSKQPESKLFFFSKQLALSSSLQPFIETTDIMTQHTANTLNTPQKRTSIRLS